MTFKVLLAGAALAAFSAPAMAGMMDATSTGHGESMSEVMPVSEGLVVVKAATVYSGFEYEGGDGPFAGYTGPCFGSIVIKDGMVSGGGHCSYSNDDGLTSVVAWTAESVSADGRTQGTWELVGGTGKWATATGSGTFDAGADADGNYTNNVAGEVAFE